MRVERRTASIARRINRSWLFRMLGILLLLDGLIAALILGGWCYWAESSLGEAVVRRTLSWNVQLPLWQRLDTLIYTLRTGTGEACVFSGEGFFPLAKWLLAGLLGLEGVLLLIQHSLGSRTAQRLLTPLERMSRTAQELSEARFDVEKLHHLEDAIATVSPMKPDARLKTDDRELQGLEKAINDLMSRMHQSYQEQSRFVSDASHELRTPIAVIQGYADMLSRWGKDDEKVLAEGIAAIQSESAHMKTLVEQLLFLARGDSNRNQMVMTQVELPALLREVYEESRMLHGDRDWQFSEEGPAVVSGDAALMKQCVRILVDNAVKYTAPGDRIALRVRLKEGVPCFEVQDNGIGIKQEDLEHIFDRFFRSDPARSRASGGTGLGLSIAKWIVERHGGYFDVFSREGIGTRMGVVLPQKENAMEEKQL